MKKGLVATIIQAAALSCPTKVFTNEKPLKRRLLKDISTPFRKRSHFPLLLLVKSGKSSLSKLHPNSYVHASEKSYGNKVQCYMLVTSNDKLPSSDSGVEICAARKA